MIAVKNLHHQYAGVVEDTDESSNHHESSQAITNHKEVNIQAMIEFIEETGSPMSLQASPILQNFVTKEVMTDDIRSDMLNIFTEGMEKYLAFQLTRFIQKSIVKASTELIWKPWLCSGKSHQRQSRKL